MDREPSKGHASRAYKFVVFRVRFQPHCATDGASCSRRQRGPGALERSRRVGLHDAIRLGLHAVQQQYTHVVEDGGVAYEFVFYPSFGWRWVVAPWVLGVGPHPYFVHGPVHFAWYARPWFRPHPLVHRDFHESPGRRR